MRSQFILLCGFLVLANLESRLTKANIAGGPYQETKVWPSNWHQQHHRTIKEENIDDHSDDQNDAFDGMSNERQTKDDIEDKMESVETKTLNSKETESNSGGLWPDKRVYYAFNPSVDREGRHEVKSVLREWEGNSCLKFLARGTQSRYIEFVYQGRCYVEEDKPDSKRIISIGSKSQMCSRGALIKGIGQAVGITKLPEVYKRYFGPEETNVLGAEIIGRARNLYKCNQISARKGDTPPDLFFQTCFNYINDKRARAGVQPLKWRNDLADKAERWARHLADTNSLQKDPNLKKYNEGEMLSWSKPALEKCEEDEDDTCYSCRKAINTWYKKKKRHHHKRPRKSNDAYSQMTASWAKEVGFGSAVSNKYGRIVVARFRPKVEPLYVKASTRNERVQKDSSSEQSQDGLSKEPDFFGKDCLLQHNLKRANHGSPPLKWSSKLQQHAQAWANTLAATDTVEPDPDAKLKNNEGENLGWIAPAKPKCTSERQEDCYTCANIVDHWYDENKNYDFGNGMSFNEKPVHHFVQMIWKKSNELGVATAESKTRGMILVARYNPRSNVESLNDNSNSDEYEDNVKPAGTPLTSAGVPAGQKIAAIVLPSDGAQGSPSTFGAKVTPLSAGTTGAPFTSATTEMPSSPEATGTPSTTGSTGKLSATEAEGSLSTFEAKATGSTTGANATSFSSGFTGTPSTPRAQGTPSTTGTTGIPSITGAKEAPSTTGVTGTLSTTGAKGSPSTSSTFGAKATTTAATTGRQAAKLGKLSANGLSAMLGIPPATGSIASPPDKPPSAAGLKVTPAKPSAADSTTNPGIPTATGSTATPEMKPIATGPTATQGTPPATGTTAAPGTPSTTASTTTQGKPTTAGLTATFFGKPATTGMTATVGTPTVNGLTVFPGKLPAPGLTATPGKSTTAAGSIATSGKPNATGSAVPLLGKSSAPSKPSPDDLTAISPGKPSAMGLIGNVGKPTATGLTGTPGELSPAGSTATFPSKTSAAGSTDTPHAKPTQADLTSGLVKPTETGSTTTLGKPTIASLTATPRKPIAVHLIPSPGRPTAASLTAAQNKPSPAASTASPNKPSSTDSTASQATANSSKPTATPATATPGAASATGLTLNSSKPSATMSAANPGKQSAAGTTASSSTPLANDSTATRGKPSATSSSALQEKQSAAGFTATGLTANQGKPPDTGLTTTPGKPSAAGSTATSDKQPDAGLTATSGKLSTAGLNVNSSKPSAGGLTVTPSGKQSAAALVATPSSASPGTSATPGGTPGGTPRSNEPYNFAKDCVDSHNELRENHGSPKVSWSEELEAHAQEWAHNLANQDAIEHDMSELARYKEGENIAWLSDQETSCATITKMWYDEIEDYDFDKGDAKAPGKQVLHFTQVVWKATTQLGVASAKSKSGKIFYVARYKPRGNFGNTQAYIDNVKPLGTPVSAPGSTTSPTLLKSNTVGTLGTSVVTLPANKLAETPVNPGAKLSGSKPDSNSRATTSAATETQTSTGTLENIPSNAKPDGTPGTTTQGTTTAIAPSNKLTSATPGNTLAAISPNTKLATTPDTTTTGTTSVTVAGTNIAGTNPVSHTATTLPASTPEATIASLPSTAPTQPSTSTSNAHMGAPNSSPGTQNAPAGAFLKKPPDLDYFFKDCLDKHNMLRAKHGAAPLTWSSELANDATYWAEYLASSNKMEHDYKQLSEKGQGENLEWLSPVKQKCMRAGQSNCYTCSQIIDMWYKEMPNYDFKTGKSTQGSIEHFVQIVWKSTREIGVGTANGNKYGLITVIRYAPKGGEGMTPQDFINNVNPVGTSTSPNQQILNCQEEPEKAANCTKWKSEGFCENFKESMRVMCPVTCGLCPAKSDGRPKFDDVPVADQRDAFEEDCLNAHNIYRAKHGVPPMLWSRKLKEDAQKWANHLADMGEVLQHDEGKPTEEGENLAHFSPPSEKCYAQKGPGCVQCREIVKDWYDEEADYDFTEGHRKPGAVVLHFTQVVWKNTRYVGVATAKNKDWFITVARYSPRGNVIGQFRDNVPAIGGAVMGDQDIKVDSEQQQFKLPPRKLYAPLMEEPVYPEDIEVKYFATNSPYGNGEMTGIMDDKPPASYTYDSDQPVGAIPYSAPAYDDTTLSSNNLLPDMRVEDDLATNEEQNEGMLLMADGKRKKSIVKSKKQ